MKVKGRLVDKYAEKQLSGEETMDEGFHSELAVEYQRLEAEKQAKILELRKAFLVLNN